MENLNKTTMSNADRLALAEKLDKDLENFINGLERHPYTEGWPEDRWQEEMEKHPFFMKKAPEVGEELSPIMEGLQQLKYDPNENTPIELANAYKEDGNFNFKYKNYRLSIIAYTEAIKVKCGDKEIEATLYNNRSAANYFLKNYRSALRDCEIALKFKNDYDKVTARAARCCFEIGQFEKAIEYCDIFLTKNSDEDIVQLKQKCIDGAKSKSRDLRKKHRLENKKKSIDDKLLSRIRESGAKLNGNLNLEDLCPPFPPLSDHRVFLNDENKLVWPVMILYPEYEIMDCIQQFVEDNAFSDHLCLIFENYTVWDVDHKYSANNVHVYYENGSKTAVIKIDVIKTLAEIIKSEGYVIQYGTPTFFILAQNSKAETTFLEKYSLH